jgi:hypothetical protein
MTPALQQVAKVYEALTVHRYSMFGHEIVYREVVM